MSSSNDENKKIGNLGEFFTEQASQGFLDLKRRFLHNSNKLSFQDEGKKFTQELLNEVTEKQLEKQKLLDDYSNSQGLVSGTIVNLAGGLIRNTTDLSSLAINILTGPHGAAVNILSNVAEYAWDESSLYDRNIITDWDNEKDIVSLIPGALFGMASVKLSQNNLGPGDLLKPNDVFIKKNKEKKKITVDIQALNSALDEANVPPLEKIIEKNKLINPEILEQNLKNGNGIIHLQDYAEVIKRQEWGEPQGNYSNTVPNEIQNYLEYATNLDKIYKHEKGKTTIFQGKDIISVYNNENASQVEVNNVFDRLASVMQKLEFFKGDKIALKAFIDKVSELEADKYTKDTWTAFEKELTEAKAVYKDENAMQEEVNSAYSELVTAFLNLRLIPNKDLLEDLINQAEGLNSTNYTKATFDGLTKALNEAKVVFENPNATQEEVDNAKDVLAKAIAGLQTVTTDNTVSTPVNNGDTTASVKTGDESLVGMFA